MLIGNNYTAMRINSQFQVMQNSQTLLNMTNNPGTANLATLEKREKAITFSSLKNWLLSRIAETSEEPQEKQKQYDIKHSFNTFG